MYIKPSATTTCRDFIIIRLSPPPSPSLQARKPDLRNYFFFLLGEGRGDAGPPISAIIRVLPTSLPAPLFGGEEVNAFNKASGPKGSPFSFQAHSSRLKAHSRGLVCSQSHSTSLALPRHSLLLEILHNSGILSRLGIFLEFAFREGVLRCQVF